MPKNYYVFTHPHIPMQLHTQKEKQIMKWPDWVEIMSNLSHVLTVVNSSVNFYIYLVKHPNILVCYRQALHLSLR